jgi:radical SAM superfamily enzyme YgiQ (UPF0313 family)
MNIALVFPPSTFLTDPLTWPPLGLFYISAQLEAQGHYTDFFDLSIDKFEIKDGDYDQIWISASAAQMYEVRKLGEKTREWEKTKTVFGGPAVWANPEGYMDLPFDLLVIGEGDHPDTIKQILGKAHNGSGVYYPELARDLEWVLPPNRRWVKNYHAYMPDREGNQRRMMSLFTSRGCPMLCSFCESGRHGVIWDALTRYEPMDIVEHQISEGRDLGFTGLAYYDDIFIVNKRRTLELLELHKRYNTVFRCFLRSDILVKHGGKDYLKELVDGGLIEIFVGVESADNRIKDNIHKGTTIEQDTMVLEWCKDLGVTCKMSFIFGLPGESYESMNRTRDWILKNKPTITQVDRLIPFPGTPLTNHPEQYDLKYEEQPDEEWFFRGRHDIDSHSFVSTSHLTRDEIDTFWRSFEKELVAEGMSGYNH